MTKKLLRCAIYIRVSTAEQAIHGKSLQAQTDCLTRYAEEHGMVIVGVFADEGKTARKNFKDRKAIKKLLEHVKNDEVDVIIFWKMDRWFRNVSDFYKIQEILDAHDTRWIAVAEPNMNMDTREGRLNLNIMLSINQNETDTTSERIRFVNEASIRQGKVISGAQPLGFRIDIIDGVKCIGKDPETEWLVHKFYEYFFLHQSKRGALMHLNQTYGTAITMNQIDLMCKNPMYYGCYRDNEHYCPSYITKQQYEILQDINTRNIKLYTSQARIGEIYLFTGLIQCPICKRPMSCNRSTKNSHTGKDRRMAYRYYRCQNWIYKKTCTYSKIANEATMESHLLTNLDQYLMEYKIVLDTIAQKKTEVRSVKHSGEKITRELGRLNHMYLKGRLSEESYDMEYERLNALFKDVEPQKEEGAPSLCYEELSTILNGDWQQIYHSLSRDNQRAFWRSVLKEIKLNEDNSFVKTVVFL